jgi:oxygen-independent coproporphyrinogen-3 oxidase
MNTTPQTPEPDNAPSGTEPAGIYVHVPFCRSKCPYCDFYSIERLDRIDAYVEALLIELAMYRQAVERVDSIYMGGGTPSLLAPGQVAGIIDAAADCFVVAEDTEITLEVNPGTVTRTDLRAFRRAGVNRLNLGLQSLDDDALRTLGRIHTSRQGLRCFDWARDAGFENLGVDLIYARPGQTKQAWQVEMASVTDLEPEHLSCYTLTLEPGTPMARCVSRGRLRPLEEGIAVELFDATIDYLETRGYRQYEISNFAAMVTDS